MDVTYKKIPVTAGQCRHGTKSAPNGSLCRRW